MSIPRTEMLELVRLTALMQRTSGLAAIRIGLIDGPVVRDHADLASPLVYLSAAACERDRAAACAHGTFVAGARIINLSLALTRGSAAQDQSLGAVLDWAAQKDVLLVAAAGDDGRVSSTALTRHPWVLPPKLWSSLGTGMGTSMPSHSSSLWA